MYKNKSVNKKIKNATKIEYKGIKFKSILECSCYKQLESSGLRFYYENERIVLWEGLKLNKVKVFSPKKSKFKYSKEISRQTRTLSNITYTPDFVVIKDNYHIYFDVKGRENDIYPLKKKMLLKYLEDKVGTVKYMFFEPHSITQMKQAIEIIKTL